MKRVLLSVAVCALVATVAVAQTRPVRVPDLIGLGLFGSDAHNGGFYDVHVASPDRARVAVVVQRGNMTRNTVEYALLVFDSTALRRAGNPDTVLLWNAASNDPAISSLQWLADNRTIAFLGARPGDVAQVYTVDVVTRTVTARTRSASGVTSFQIGRLGDPVIYQEQARVDTADYSAMRAHGFVVDNRVYPSDVIGGDWRGVRRAAGVAPGYRIMRGGREAALVFPDSTDGYRDCGVDSYLGPPLSPAGDALMITCSPLAPRPVWAAYRNARYRLFADRYS
ncbi:MAG TPA: hypothetical protein VG454_08885, partial [Gemmatimonadales bacterium]|nr:hypothetical protein [Gemmatimonadales bacterium]